MGRVRDGDFKSARPESGAAAVEMALVAPVLALLLFGIMDFGWAFSQSLNLRSAAREGARVAAVNGAPDTASIIAGIQARANELDPAQLQVSVQFEDTNTDRVFGDPGDNVVVCLRYPLRSLTGFTSSMLNGHLTTTAVMRQELQANFFPGSTGNWDGGICQS